MARRKKDPSEPEARVRGDVVSIRLDSVEPNPWNPNVVPEEIQRSIEFGFRKDGWLASQALLVWGTDETGAPRNLIIDGEHRWRAGVAVGMAQGPAVILNGITEAEAKALTVKLNQKRGAWDVAALATLLQSIQGDEVVQVDATAMGFDEDEFKALMQRDPLPYDDGAVPAASAPDGQGGDDPWAGQDGAAPGDSRFLKPTGEDGKACAPADPTHVKFQFGDHAGRVSYDVYRAFDAAFRKAKDVSGAVVVEDVLAAMYGRAAAPPPDATDAAPAEVAA